MDGKHMKLENPVRMMELNPEETLKRIGILEDSVFCDVGAGSGIFTVAAAGLTKNKVYALEIDDDMISVIKEKALGNSLANIETVKVDPESFHMADNCVDIAVMVTVLHEIADKPTFLENVKKLVKDDGKVAVIEFHKRATPMGPPPAYRIGRDEVMEEMKKIGLTVLDDFDLGENYYCLVFGNL